MSLSFTTRFPTTTATRSTILAGASEVVSRMAAKRVRIISESLSDGKEKLEVAQTLRYSHAKAGLFARRLARVAGQQLIDGAFESDERRRVDAVREIDAHRT